jgi:hypothetical protein
MEFWNRVIDFHQKNTNKFPSGERGLSAIRFLVSLFMKYGCDSLPNTHPLFNKFFFGAEFHYHWLIQYAKKLQIASTISGFSEIAPRFSNSKTFLSANNEIEVALKFHLDGLDASFIPTTKSERTPDILLKINNKKYNAEVSSLNPPDQETLMWTFHSQLSQLTIGKGLVTGGFINIIPDHNVLARIINRVKEKIDEIQVTNEAGRINEPRYATIYIAPRDNIESIPKDCRGMFRIAQPYRRTTQEKIEWKIKEKYDQLFSSDYPSLLYLYSQIIDKEKLYNLFDNVVDNMEVILPSYSKLIGLVLTVPHLGFEVLSGMTSLSTMEKKEEKTYLESEIGKGQYESSLIWKNVHSDYLFPVEIGDAIEKYSSNVKKIDDLSLI